MPSLQRPEPPYVQIATQIRDRIKSGALRDGDKLPSARQITRDWDVAIATAAKALGLLAADGLTRVVPGVGTVVQTGALHLSAKDLASSIQRTGRIYPPGHYAKIGSAGLAAAPERVAGALGITVGEEAIRRQRTTYGPDDSPLSMSVSWFAPDLVEFAPLLLETSRIVQGTSRYVEEQTGRVAVSTHVRHAAAAAADDQAAELGIAPGSPVLVSRNRFLDSTGAVLEYGESVALPDHWVYYEYTHESGS